MLYALGKGVAQDSRLAAEWLGKSAAQGDEDAAKALQLLQQEGIEALVEKYNTVTVTLFEGDIIFDKGIRIITPK